MIILCRHVFAEHESNAGPVSDLGQRSRLLVVRSAKNAVAADGQMAIVFRSLMHTVRTAHAPYGASRIGSMPLLPLDSSGLRGLNLIRSIGQVFNVS
jgi:hypothetical protein